MCIRDSIQTVDQVKAIKTVKGKISDIDKMKEMCIRDSYMPGVYKIPMVRMTEMSDEAPECKGLKVPHSEMGVWVKAQAVRFSRNGCYETPWHVTGVSKLSGPEGTPKGMYVQIGLSEQGKAGSLLDNPAKNNKRMNSC